MTDILQEEVHMAPDTILRLNLLYPALSTNALYNGKTDAFVVNIGCDYGPQYPVPILSVRYQYYVPMIVAPGLDGEYQVLAVSATYHSQVFPVDVVNSILAYGSVAARTGVSAVTTVAQFTQRVRNTLATLRDDPFRIGRFAITEFRWWWNRPATRVPSQRGNNVLQEPYFRFGNFTFATLWNGIWVMEYVTGINTPTVYIRMRAGVNTYPSSNYNVPNPGNNENDIDMINAEPLPETDRPIVNLRDLLNRPVSEEERTGGSGDLRRDIEGTPEGNAEGTAPFETNQGSTPF
jgi:hypothetical protein